MGCNEARNQGDLGFLSKKAEPPLTAVLSLFFHNPLSAISAAHIHMGVGPSPGTWSTYQESYHTPKEVASTSPGSCQPSVASKLGKGVLGIGMVMVSTQCIGCES